jgi:hypothetical protein
MMALRADHEIDHARALEDLLSSACATQPATAIMVSRLRAFRARLTARTRPSSE